jgi:hypothetical protein
MRLRHALVVLSGAAAATLLITAQALAQGGSGIPRLGNTAEDIVEYRLPHGVRCYAYLRIAGAPFGSGPLSRLVVPSAALARSTAPS